MLPRLFTRELLRPQDLEPSDPRLRVCGVLNPGVAEIEGETVLIARVAEEPVESRAGHHASPRIADDGSLAIDFLPANQCNADDPRVYQVGPNKLVRLRFISHLRVFRSTDPHRFDPASSLTVRPQGEAEEYGIEDPRVTRIGSTWYLTCVVVSRHGVATALMSTTDFHRFERHGTIFCPDNKDVLLFPEKVGGSHLAMHRPMHSIPFCPLQVCLARSPDLRHWGGHTPLLGGGGGEVFGDRVGGSTPPLLTDAGWLTLYHGSERAPAGRTVGRYVAAALLLDAATPQRIVGHSDGPVMVPSEPFETAGYVNEVVFPTAMIDRGDRYDVYYGAADTSIGVCGFDKQAMLDAAQAIAPAT